MSAWAAAGWGALASSSLLLGAWFAIRARPGDRLVGWVMAVGAGALLGAVAYELVPKGLHLDGWVFAALGAGAAAFYLADRAVTGRTQAGATAGRSIALGALLDAVPESVVLGMGIAAGGGVSIAFLAAVFLSNLPEALGASAGMARNGQASGRIYRMWAVIVAVSGLCAAAGYGVLRLVPAAGGRYVQAFAAGAVLTMLADLMMAEGFTEGGRLGGPLTVAGFAIAGALTTLE
ncbi:ZIP family zinc transporter [Micromonospora sp. CPCC 205371]|nr:ZIP family zinc transporter [Micromonospora sp. CPCC 205371]